VLGHAGVLMEELGPDHPLGAHVQTIQKAAHRASDLTRQLLAYTGRGQFHQDDLDLSMEVREMLQLLEVTLPRNVALELDLAPELPAVQGDHIQIQQVLANLLINASEAIAERPGWVRITTTPLKLSGPELAAALPGQELDPGVFVRLEVRDNGAGMDEATLARCFEPFFTTKFQGRGLGMPAVLGIVRGHRGAVKLESTSGTGTCCSVFFPAVPAAGPGGPSAGDAEAS
jgi:signal transduction histidine kinase